MKQIAVLGTNEFTLGFRLAGIRNIIDVSDEGKGAAIFGKVRENKSVGIVVVEEKLLDRLDPADRKEIENNVNPVFLPLSTHASQESLRKMIIRSIGVDLWGKEDAKEQDNDNAKEKE